ncbi:uncharacterized protein LOC129290224 [Prosopis cineraria]|uniref:uncharacterized protein LOC129290224 n=1 Tax=Prosopis cineraria TaxID=364024 RepID=UPI00240EA420|nr:uncharacterized protein LOC129290224 [Prosopis cineraria]
MNPIKTRSLEVTVISGHNLCIGQNPVTEDMHVVVRTESLNCWTTTMAKQGGDGSGSGYCAIWNDKLMVEAPLHAKSITFEVECKTSKGVVRSIGLARIAISDVVPKEEGCSSEVLSYRLRNWEGRRSGVISFSVKTKKYEDDGSMWSRSGGFHHHMDVQNNGLVLGIPVWWNHLRLHV